MPGRRSGLVFVHPSDELYGADRMLLAMLEAVGDRPEVEVWLPSDLEHPERPLCIELESRGYRYRHVDLPILRRAYQTPSGMLRLGRRFLGLVRELRRAAPERVYCTTTAAVLGAPAARLAGVPRVAAHLQEIWGRFERLALAAPLACAPTRLTNSETVRDSLPRRLRPATTVVHNGTPAPPTVTSLEGRTGPLTFAVASRWTGGKGYETLLRAWDLAGGPGRLLILGGRPPIGEWTDVPGLVGAMRHGDSVEIVGEVADPAPYLERADVAVVPSEYPEGFGLVAIEAFARARPVVASTAGGLREIVTPGSDGWSFPPGDVGALATILSGLTRDDVTRAGERARQTFLEHFTQERWIESWAHAVFDESPERARTSPQERD